jgi:hypothetical protein
VAVRESVEHIHVRPDALAERAGAGEGTLITNQERRTPSKSRFVSFVRDHVSRAQPYKATLIQVGGQSPALRHTRTCGAYLDFDGALTRNVTGTGITV